MPPDQFVRVEIAISPPFVGYSREGGVRKGRVCICTSHLVPRRSRSASRVRAAGPRRQRSVLRVRVAEDERTNRTVGSGALYGIVQGAVRETVVDSCATPSLPVRMYWTCAVDSSISTETVPFSPFGARPRSTARWQLKHIRIRGRAPTDRFSRPCILAPPSSSGKSEKRLVLLPNLLLLPASVEIARRGGGKTWGGGSRWWPSWPVDRLGFQRRGRQEQGQGVSVARTSPRATLAPTSASDHEIRTSSFFFVPTALSRAGQVVQIDFACGQKSVTGTVIRDLHKLKPCSDESNPSSRTPV